MGPKKNPSRKFRRAKTFTAKCFTDVDYPITDDSAVSDYSETESIQMMNGAPNGMLTRAKTFTVGAHADTDFDFKVSSNNLNFSVESLFDSTKEKFLQNYKNDLENFRSLENQAKTTEQENQILQDAYETLQKNHKDLWDSTEQMRTELKALEDNNGDLESLISNLKVQLADLQIELGTQQEKFQYDLAARDEKINIWSKILIPFLIKMMFYKTKSKH